MDRNVKAGMRRLAISRFMLLVKDISWKISILFWAVPSNPRAHPKIDFSLLEARWKGSNVVVTGKLPLAPLLKSERLLGLLHAIVCMISSA